jgi:hypothetical protein
METAIFYFCAAYLCYVAITFGLGIIGLWEKCGLEVLLPRKQPLEATKPIIRPIISDHWFEVSEVTLVSAN